jgi:peptidoglycan/LPS O-acetylase OafA/YrhL
MNSVGTSIPQGAASNRRLQAIDGIRGFAALAVVLYHVPHKLREAASIPDWLEVLFSNGLFGVDAFFVLSGFVMALSVSSGDWRLSYLPRFMARRSLRLDPSYWLAIAIELMLGWVGLHLLADAYPFPSWSEVGAHLFYLQGVLGFEQISDVFWTLCFEVQFYLLLVGTLVVTHKLFPAGGVKMLTTLSVILASLVVWSLLVRSGLAPEPNGGLVVVRLYQFGFGIIAYLIASRRGPQVLLLSAVTSIVGARLLAGAFVESLVMGTAAAICCSSLRHTSVNRWSQNSVVQFLGRISYSLYLYHASIVGRSAAVTLLLVERTGYSWLPIMGIVASVIGSILFSYLLYALVEKPTSDLAKRISLPSRYVPSAAKP